MFMKFPKLLFVMSLATVAFVPVLRAELVSEEVREQAVTPEAPALEDEVVILKKPKTVKKPVMVQEEVAYEPALETAPRQSVGSALDKGIQTKMGDVQTQFENALLKTLDRIKITVDDGAAVSQQQTQIAPVTTTVVTDSVVNTNAAPGYISVEDAPTLADEEGGESVAQEEKKSSLLGNRLRLAPVLGWTTINSDFYDIDSRYTAGLNIEMDVSENLAAVLGYSYSQYDIAPAMGSPFMGGGYNNSYGMNTLQYNQNVFDAVLRFYLFPQESKFRAFIGGGVGYNKGYLNYRQGVFNTYAYNPYMNLEDYEVSSFLGILETGAEIRVGESIALGANFKYSNVLSSSENQPLNNYGFTQNGYGANISPDQQVVGGSIAGNSFYSILGTVKVSF